MTDQNAADLISIPTGGGAISGIGDTFQPDLNSGTGNLTVPLQLPPGRNGLQPSLALSYTTGNPNGPYGLGWSLPVPGVRRKTDKGIPRYDPDLDTFILSGAEDLVPVSGMSTGAVRYRPRTEVGYARITHLTGPGGDYWEVWSTDGLRSRYGTPRPQVGPPGWADPAVVADPDQSDRTFAWLLTETVDPLGNKVSYTYEPDQAGTAQRYLSEISYADYGEPASPQYLVTVKIVLDSRPRPDPFTDHRPGFEVRTTQRVAAIETWTQHGASVLARRVELAYADQTGTPPTSGMSLLTRVTIMGIDGDTTEALPPLELGYTSWDPAARRYQPLTVTAARLPATSLAGPGLDLVDMFGDGLVSILQLNGTAQYWRNRGDGGFDQPRNLAYTPAGVKLGDPGVQLADLDGDGRPDLLLSTPVRTGYWPLAANGGFDPAGYVPVSPAPTVSLSDPLVRLIDLDGDGITDALRTGDRFELFYSDRGAAFNHVQVLSRGGDVPDVTFGDPRVFLADMTGDGLTDLVLAHDGNISYWPYQGYGSWGAKVVMRNPPTFPDAASYAGTGFDPRRLLLGDVDGDGCADVVYVGNDAVTIWINQTGNGFTDPITIRGTPRAAGASVRLADMAGTGTAGLLWTYDLGTVRGSSYKFLDLTGGTKPYLLNQIDNHAGATTAISYAPSTAYATADRAVGRPWQTTLPFPVQVVAATTVADYFSQTTLTSEYLYHNGYWDGADREFRGFARVDRRDALLSTNPLEEPFYSPPTEIRTWFHLGPVGPESGAWTDGLDLSGEYWPGDPPLGTQIDISALPAGMNRRGLRYAIRALRGQVLRTELYALDGSDVLGRPYELTDYRYAIAPVLDRRSPDDPVWQANPVVSVRRVMSRTSVWDRGNEAMTNAWFTGGFDDYGRPHTEARVAVPHGRDPRVTVTETTEPYLTSVTMTGYATRDDPGHYLINRVSTETRVDVPADGGTDLMSFGRQLISQPPAPTADTIRSRTLTYYDGPAYQGQPLGQLGEWGLRTRVQRLAFTSDFLASYQDGDPHSPPPPYLQPGKVVWTAEYPEAFQAQVPALAGYTYQPAADGLPACWYVEAERAHYDVQGTGTGRGLLVGQQDPTGNVTTLSYDPPYNMLVAAVTDAIGLTRSATYDYRLFQPVTITDVNGNQTIIGHTPLGLPAWIAATGKPGARPPQGDTVDQPSLLFEYGLTAWDQSTPGARQPLSARTTRRIQHRWALVAQVNAERAQKGLPPLTDAQIAAMFPPNERDVYPERFIRKQEYSDGLGRLLQTRSQSGNVILDDLGLTADMNVAPGPVLTHQQNPAGPPQVVVSGWQTYDNKGRIVEKYEPSFGSGWDYQLPEPGLAKISISYDPRGLAVKTGYPDGSEQLLVPGVPRDVTQPDSYQPTPWETYAYDNDDNAGRTHPSISAGWSSVNTPASVVIDALGRTIQSFERTHTNTLVTANTYDIDDNLLTTTDPLGRIAVTNLYDLLGRIWRQSVLDSGTARTVLDAAGTVIERRDDKGALQLTANDPLLRPVRRWARDRASQTATLREVIVYGDNESGSGLSRPAAAAANLLARPYRTYDEAGLVITDSYDLDGNLLRKTRRTLPAAVLLRRLPSPGGDWSDTFYPIDWQPPPGQSPAAHAESFLGAIRYTTDTVYDALQRPTAITCPLDADAIRRTIYPIYDGGGLLTGLNVGHTPYLQQILYNPKGQRVTMNLGSGTLIRYVYYPGTFRLARLRSEPAPMPPLPSQQHPFQDYGYSFDLIGNLLALDDRTPGSGVPPNADRLSRSFVYDALYRLTSATGRECGPSPNPPWNDQPRCTTTRELRPYIEIYSYDDAGNLLHLSHQNSTGGLTRDYALDGHNNRLTAVTANSSTHEYAYDPSGNMLSEGTGRIFEWDHLDRLATYRSHAQGADPSAYTQYRYDSTGHRVLKLTQNQGGDLTVTTYVDGIFERITTNEGTAHDRIHLLDKTSRIAILQAGRPLPGDSSPAVAYHLGDHIGSSNAVLDGTGTLFSREEYTPYGETTFGSYPGKRYRYAAKERDEDSSLCYYGARYYAPWLCRWTSCDPVLSLNEYLFGRDNPVRYLDPDGRLLTLPLEGGPPLELMADALAKMVSANPKSVLLGGSGLGPVVAAGVAVLGLIFHLSNELGKENREFKRAFAENHELRRRLDQQIELMWKNGVITHEQLLLFRAGGGLPGILESGTSEGLASWQAGLGLQPVTALQTGAALKLAPATAMEYARAYFGRFSETPQLRNLWNRARAWGRSYERARTAFWWLVNNDPGPDAEFARQMLIAAGAQIQVGTSRAPLLKMRTHDPRLSRELSDLRISIDHIEAQSKRPDLSTDPDNLHFEMQRENSFRGDAPIDYPRSEPGDWVAPSSGERVS